MKFCKQCNQLIENSRKQLCEECRNKNHLESRRKAIENLRAKRKKLEVGKYQNKECEICGEKMFNVFHRQKYCDLCSKALQLKRIKEHMEKERKRTESWNKLSEKEKLRRMNLVCEKILN
jgi:hypothetical protein